MFLGLADGVFAEMKDRGRQHSAGPALGDAFNQMIQITHATRGDHRHIHRVTDRAGQGQVEPGLGAVAVHRGQQNLARTLGNNGFGKLHRVDAGGFAAAMGKNLPLAGADGFGVDGADDALAAELIRRFGDHIWVGHGGRVEADLVRPRQQQGAHVVLGPHAATHGQRDETLFGGALHHIEHGAPVFMGRVDVQKTDLIRAGGIIGLGRFHRVARIAQADEIDTLDHTAIGDIKAGNDPGFQHGASFVGAPLPAKPR